MAVTVQWVKCGDHWCSFANVNLANVKTYGVYMIWHEGSPPKTVRVGQGDITQRLNAHRQDDEITDYEAVGTLRVTWAACTAAQADGIERYLAETYSPLVGDRWPDVTPIAVNGPQ